MARKHDTKKLREAIAALVDLEVKPAEILRRLQNDECDIGYPIDISIRSVHYHKTRHEEEKARAELQKTTASQSIEAAKQKAADLLARELLAHERKPAGSMGSREAAAVERIHLALSRMEKAERARPTKPQKNSNGQGKEENAIERLARQARDQQASGVGVDEGEHVAVSS
jgi:hypothetical protein